LIGCIVSDSGSYLEKKELFRGKKESALFGKASTAVKQ
jgi:hypothetical protein